MTPRRVLFVDLAPTPAGSIASLRYLVRDVDRTRYQPLVLLSSANRAVAWFEQMDVPLWTIPSRQGQGVSLGSGVDALRRGKVGAWVRSRPQLAGIWHTVGALERWRRKLWPEAQRIRQVIGDTRPDIIHLNAELVVNRPGVLAAYQEHVPAIIHVRGWESWDLWDRLLSRTVRRYVCISQAVARPLVEMGVPPSKIKVIYNGVDVDDVPIQPRPELYEELGLSAKAPVVGIVGRLVGWKGHPVFLRAFARVAQDIPHVQGLVVGAVEITDPQYLDKLLDLTRELGVEKQVRFVGHRDDVLDIYPLLDVLVHASVRDEPFGRVIIEGMAAARPVVATRGGGTPEIVREGETGFLVPQGDPEAMADAILYLLHHPQEARRMGQTARADVARRFRSDEAARALMAVYDRIGGGRTRG